jgi:GNAT superfamily N-acetyltransferase
MATDVRLVRTPEEFRQFRELVIEYEDSLPEDLRHPDFQEQLQRLEIYYGPPNAAFIATIDTVPGGCVGLAKLDAATAIVKKLYVKPAYRSLGLARALVAAVLHAARERRLRRVVLDTERERLQAAYNLYVSLGFKECEPYGPVDYSKPTFMELTL